MIEGRWPQTTREGRGNIPQAGMECCNWVVGLGMDRGEMPVPGGVESCEAHVSCGKEGHGSNIPEAEGRPLSLRLDVFVMGCKLSD